jgi:hypothetical protein
MGSLVGDLEGLIDEVGTRGLKVNNLFQFAGGWRANLTDGHAFYEFGEGFDAVEALRAALEKAGMRSVGAVPGTDR